jgi:hypothetical protein
MTDAIIRVHITLLDADPAIWRRIEVPADATLKTLHDVIQLVMGWYDGHLHHFAIGNTLYGKPMGFDDALDAEMVSETRMKLARLVDAGERAFEYVYDYGDDWHVAVVLESYAPAEQGVVYPRLIEGAQSGPPEDVGGVWGYAEFLEAIVDPEHEEHDHLIEWSGGNFDPERFDINEINPQLSKLSKRKSRRRKTKTSPSSGPDRQS